jgi:hypothetical protein
MAIMTGVSLSVVGSSVVGLAAALSAQSTPSGADLAQQYLAALEPAGSAISSAEAKLDKLAVTASVAQVKAIVAPLGPALAKLEALTSGGAIPLPPVGSGPSLESLGYPTVVAAGLGNATCPRYSTSASGADLQVGYTKYHSGFQMTSPNCANWVNYSWKVPGKYTRLTADLGYNYNNACFGSTVRFLGNGGAPLQFTSAGGKLVGAVTVPRSGVAAVSVNFAGNSVLAIQVGFACGGANSIIDVVNDRLS